MRTLVFGLVLSAAALTGMAAVHAAVDLTDQAPPEAAGDWRLSEIGGKIACTLTFTLQLGAGGYEVKAPMACRRAFPPLQTVAAWAVDEKGGIVLSDAQAKPIIVFPEEEGGSYQAKAPDGRTWRLEPVKPPHAAG
jgi:hypothetical protein